MSDGSRFDLPSELFFASRVGLLADELIEAGLTDSNLSEKTQLRVRQTGWLALTGSETEQQHIPANILSSDTTIVDAVSLVGMDRDIQSETYYLSIELLKDGSPFIAKDDESVLEVAEHYGIEPGSEYVIFAGPELPPSIVNYSYLAEADIIDGGNGGNTYSIKSLNQVRAIFGALAIRQLKASECADVLAALSQPSATADIAEWVSMFGA